MTWSNRQHWWELIPTGKQYVLWSIEQK